MKKVVDEAAQMKIREEQQAREQQLKQESGVGDHGVNSVASSVASAPTSAPGYASSLTSWAASAVTSNVSKIVGSSSDSTPARGGIATAPSSSSRVDGLANSFHPSSQPHAGMQLQSSTSGSHNTNAFASAGLSMDDDDDQWGDDNELDLLTSPKTSSFTKSHPVSSSFSSTGATKLSVARASMTPPKSALFAPASLTAGAESGWGEDNWGGDDDLDLDEPTSSVGGLRVGSSSSSTAFGGSSSSFSASFGSSTTSTFSAAPPPSKPISERRAETKAKRENLGAMKLNASATATKKGDEWDNWDF